MVYMNTSTFVSKNCPACLRQIADELVQIEQYAFPDNEELVRYLEGLEQRCHKISPVTARRVLFCHEVSSYETKLTVIHASSSNIFIRVFFKAVKGHVYVSKDKMKIKREDFIKEGGAAC